MRLFFSAIILMVLCVAMVGCQNPALTSAKIYMKQGQLDEAIEQLKIVIEQEPDNAEAYYKLGTIYAEKSQYPEMNQAFDKALELDEKKYGSEVEMWRVGHWTRNFNSGIEALNKAREMEKDLAVEPDNAELAEGIQSMYQRAVGRFKEAIAIIPERSEAWSDLGFVYFKLGRSEESLDAYRRAVELTPDDPETWRRVAVSYFNEGQYLQAAESYDNVLALLPDDRDALMMRAASYDQGGEEDKAIEAYEDAIDLIPEDRDLYYNLGVLYFQQRKDYQLASDAFRKALEIDPEDAEANFNLGIIHFTQDQWDEALPYFKKVVELEPKNIEGWEKLGVIYLRKGMRKEGEEALKKTEEYR